MKTRTMKTRREETIESSTFDYIISISKDVVVVKVLLLLLRKILYLELLKKQKKVNQSIFSQKHKNTQNKNKTKSLRKKKESIDDDEEERNHDNAANTTRRRTHPIRSRVDDVAFDAVADRSRETRKFSRSGVFRRFSWTRRYVRDGTQHVEEIQRFIGASFGAKCRVES